MARTLVQDLMSSKVITVTPGTSTAEALSTMFQNNFRHLPVVDGHQVIGMLSMRDLLKYLCQIK